MAMLTFIEFIIRHEGVLMADRPPATGLPRLNTTAVGSARRAKLRTNPTPPSGPARPTVAPVSQIVPQEFLAKRQPSP